MSEPLFYEDVRIGLAFETAALTVTGRHIDEFAGLSGDFFELHMDAGFARSLGFSGRVAHGLLGLILTDGLKNRATVRFAAIASLSWEWNFRKPLYPGDTIRARINVKDKRLTQRADRGILTLAFEVYNGGGDIVQDGSNRLMVRARGATEPAPSIP